MNRRIKRIMSLEKGEGRDDSIKGRGGMTAGPRKSVKRGGTK